MHECPRHDQSVRSVIHLCFLILASCHSASGSFDGGSSFGLDVDTARQCQPILTTPHPTDVITDDTFAYVSSDGFIWKIGLADGQATTLASNISAWSIAIDGDQVFVTGNGVSR